MIVEDEALIALQLEDDVITAGHEVVGCAMQSGEAVRLAAATRPDLALVDVHLSDGPTGVDAARAIVRSGCPVIFLTANAKRIPEDFAGAIGVMGKPYNSNALLRGLQFVGARIRGRLAPPAPGALTIAPDWLARWGM